MSPASRTAALVLGAAVAAAMPSAAGAAGARPLASAERVRAPTAALAWRARVVGPTPARSRPVPGARRVGTISPVTAWGGNSVSLLVLATSTDRLGRRWLRLRLAARPNTRSAWVLADRVAVSPVRWRVVISRAARRATAYRDGRAVRSWRVVIGAAGTPTPTGLFAVYELIRQPAGSELGPWALHLTAHSPVLFDFGGGPGRVALHGRAGPLLAAPLGTAASRGCVRMDSGVISWLARRVRAGTPVRIR